VQKLTTIAELKTAGDIKWVLDLLGMIGWMYDEFLKSDVGGYSYTVSAGPESDRKPGIHASEISNCARQLVYGIGTERRPDPARTDVNMRRRFRLGTAVHAMIQDELMRMCAKGAFVGPNGLHYYMTFEPENKILPNLPGPATDHGVDSSTDGLFTVYVGVAEPEPHWEVVLRFLVEIKTKSKDEYDKMTKPDAPHVEQTHLYMGCLDVPITWMLYYNKSNSNYTKPISPYVFRFNEKLWSDLELRFLRSNHMATVGQLPERTEGMHCSWCPFSYTCQPPILARLSSMPPAANPVASSTSLRRLGGRRR
jgi:CRISPR/Cas system-associated exonuclease Cas4 (RecB family)